MVVVATIVPMTIVIAMIVMTVIVVAIVCSLDDAGLFGFDRMNRAGEGGRICA